MVIRQIPGIPRAAEVTRLAIFMGIEMPNVGLKACKVIRAPVLKNMDFKDATKGFGSLKILNIK